MYNDNYNRSNNQETDDGCDRHRWTKCFHIFLIFNVVALVICLVGLILFKDESMERAKKVEAELISPLSLTTCIENQAEAEALKKTLGLIDYIVKSVSIWVEEFIIQ